MRFAGNITYDETTVKRMEKVRYRTFSLVSSAVRVLCAVIMVVCGYLTGGKTGTVFVAFGCILAVSSDVVGRWRCSETIKALKGGSIRVKYEFYDRHFLTITNGTPTQCDYTDLILLMEDGQYYYLFPNQYQVYMIAANSLQPDDSAAFHELLGSAGDLEWIRPLSLITANLRQIITFWRGVEKGKKRKENHGYS